MKRLKNKITIITGGAKGIGQGIVELFLKEGATVILCDIDKKSSSSLLKNLAVIANFFILMCKKRATG